MAVTPPICDFGWKAPDFRLKAVDGQSYSLQDLQGENGTLIVFMCNHCPYVLAILDRLIRDASALADYGIATIAINSNDPLQYPDDSFENMQKMAQAHDFPFPYLFDETQDIARAYDAQCTPDFFGFNADNALQYRGRLDASRKEAAGKDVRRDLFEAMKAVAQTGQGPEEQISSMGCSIKWKASH